MVLKSDATVPIWKSKEKFLGVMPIGKLPEISRQDINKLPAMPVTVSYIQQIAKNVSVKKHLKDQTNGKITLLSTMLSKVSKLKCLSQSALVY